MKTENKKYLWFTITALLSFVLWTILICVVDVQAIGPRNSEVGFASVNRHFHGLTGVHMTLYHITDWLGLVPVGFMLGFAITGLVQWIQRKHIWKVDYSILVLGGFYLVVLAAYLLFEEFVINYRPVLISGYLEASYPSSTTLLVLCVMPTAMQQLNGRINNIKLGKYVRWTISVFVTFMVIGRLVSGVHWITDIIGGILLSTALVSIYCFAISIGKK